MHASLRVAPDRSRCDGVPLSQRQAPCVWFLAFCSDSDGQIAEQDLMRSFWSGRRRCEPKICGLLEEFTPGSCHPGLHVVRGWVVKMRGFLRLLPSSYRNGWIPIAGCDLIVAPADS